MPSSASQDRLAFFCCQRGDNLDSIYLIDEYVSVMPGDPFRLFPFGRIVKDGNEIDFTPEFASKFKLPHFKPPIKRGSHNDDTPAGGFIVGLEVREDGLYAIPEFNEKGIQAVNDGDYRYHSPEVVWGDGPVFENPETGEYIHGPLIVGDALLHMPHLGESAALYTVEPIREVNMTEKVETVEVPKKWYDGVFAMFQAKEPEPIEEPKQEPVIEADKFEALQVERDNFEAEINRMKAEVEKTERIEKYTAAVKETKANEEFAEILAGLEDETADRIVQEFKALSEQIKEADLLSEKGTSGDGLPEDPREALNAAIKAKMEEAKVDYNAAFRMVREESPELVTNQKGGK